MFGARGGTIEGQVQGSGNVCAQKKKRGEQVGQLEATCPSRGFRAWPKPINKEKIILIRINLKKKKNQHKHKQKQKQNKKKKKQRREERGTAAVEIRTAHIDDEDARVSLLEEERGEIFRRDALEVLGNGNLQLGLRYASFHLLLVLVFSSLCNQQPNAVFVVLERVSTGNRSWRHSYSPCNLILDTKSILLEKI
jgi:hypothetical protein